MYGSLLMLVASGVAAGAMGGWLGRLWIWTSIGVLLGVAVTMMVVAGPHYLRIRQLVGASISPRRPRGVASPGDSAGVEGGRPARLRPGRPGRLAGLGGGG